MSGGAATIAHPVQRIALSVLICALLAACGSVERRPVVERDAGAAVVPADPATSGMAARPAPPAATSPPSTSQRGAYYKDDGPGDNPPDLAAVPEPEPKAEPLHRFANRPYNVFGQDYVPEKAIVPFRQRGLGSWYGKKFHGQRTASGERYDMYAMTAAHPTLPIPSYVQVTSVANGRSVIVRVNDRGPFHPGRIIDLSYTAAWKLGYVNAGSTQVEIELITPEQIPVIAAKRRADAKTQLAAARARVQSPVQRPGQIAAQPPAPVQVDPAPAADVPVQTAALVSAESPQAQVLAAAPPPAQAPAEPAASMPVEVGARGVFLQLGAFSGRATAETFRARVYRELTWLKDAINIRPRDGLFRLHLGPYRDRGEASSMAERIRAALEVNPVIVIR